MQLAFTTPESALLWYKTTCTRRLVTITSCVHSKAVLLFIMQLLHLSGSNCSLYWQLNASTCKRLPLPLGQLLCMHVAVAGCLQVHSRESMQMRKQGTYPAQARVLP